MNSSTTFHLKQSIAIFLAQMLVISTASVVAGDLSTVYEVSAGTSHLRGHLIGSNNNTEGQDRLREGLEEVMSRQQGMIASGCQ